MNPLLKNPPKPKPSQDDVGDYRSLVSSLKLSEGAVRSGEELSKVQLSFYFSFPPLSYILICNIFITTTFTSAILITNDLCHFHHQHFQIRHCRRWQIWCSLWCQGLVKPLETLSSKTEVDKKF